MDSYLRSWRGARGDAANEVKELSDFEAIDVCREFVVGVEHCEAFRSSLSRDACDGRLNSECHVIVDIRRRDEQSLVALFRR